MVATVTRTPNYRHWPTTPPTNRIYARTQDEAAQMVSPSDALPELDLHAYADGGSLPFTTTSAIVRCLNCCEFMAVEMYVHPSHGCVRPGSFVDAEWDDDLTDLNFDDDDYATDWAVDFGAALGLAIVAATAAATLGVIVAALVSWATA
jgi:hypothetical protein